MGQAYCGTLNASEVPEWLYSNDDTIQGMPLQTAKSRLESTFKKNDNSMSFQDHWDAIIDKLSRSQDSLRLVLIRDKARSQHRILVSSKPPMIPFTCRSRMFLIAQIRAFWLELLILGTSLVVGVYIWFSRVKHAQYVKIASIIMVRSFI